MNYDLHIQSSAKQYHTRLSFKHWQECGHAIACLFLGDGMMPGEAIERGRKVAAAAKEAGKQDQYVNDKGYRFSVVYDGENGRG